MGDRFTAVNVDGFGNRVRHCCVTVVADGRTACNQQGKGYAKDGSGNEECDSVLRLAAHRAIESFNGLMGPLLLLGALSLPGMCIAYCKRHAGGVSCDVGKCGARKNWGRKPPTFGFH